jgi:phosphoesterase RecJ-like protein
VTNMLTKQRVCLMKENILNKIQQYETIIIHRHVRPDPDALGSQGGLAEIIKQSYPAKIVKVVGEEDPSLTFLNCMDVIEDAEYQGALVIICDTANQGRISDERYKLGDFIIKIDHHPNADPYGDMVWVDTSSSSVSEMIYDLYKFGSDRNELILSEQSALLLYAGIVGDTGRFLYSNTAPKTLQFAGELLSVGIDPAVIYENMYKEQLNLARLNGYVLQTFTYLEEGAGYIFLDQQVLQKYGVTVSEASLLVNTFSNVEGLKAWVFFIEEPDQIRVRLRSKGPVVDTIAAKYNGGGHPRASGATVYTSEETERVIQDLVQACKRPTI